MTRAITQNTTITLSVSPSISMLVARERPLAIAAEPALGQELALVAIVTSVFLAHLRAT